MPLNIFPLITFLFTTFITPGPNNITGASLGIQFGYKRSYKYVLGVAFGFFFIMVLTGLLSGFLLNFVPGFTKAVRIIGAVYILWMAYELFRSTFSKEISNQVHLGFQKGLALQFLNPKVMFMGMALYSSFLSDITKNISLLIFSALILGCLAFTATSIWTLAGSVLFQKLKNPVILRIVNSSLALLLVYTAVELSGLFFQSPG